MTLDEVIAHYRARGLSRFDGEHLLREAFRALPEGEWLAGLAKVDAVVFPEYESRAPEERARLKASGLPKDQWPKRAIRRMSGLGVWTREYLSGHPSADDDTRWQADQWVSFDMPPPTQEGVNELREFIRRIQPLLLRNPST